MNLRITTAVLLAIPLALGGCSDRKLRPLNPCTVTGVVGQISGGYRNVDLLFLVDDSGSMADEQAALAEQLPNVVRVLLSGEIPGQAPFPPVSSLRVGVIGSDMGVLGVGSIPTAVEPERTSQAIPGCGTDDEGRFFGEDGAIRLETTASPLPAGCEAVYPSYLQFDADGSTLEEDFVTDVACTALLGTGGCGFEMQLESILVAVTDSSRPDAPAFAPTMSAGAPRDRVGRATPGEPNHGFFREGSIIAIVAVTDEEDCSTDDPELFMADPRDSELQDPAHDDFTSGDFRVNTRCLFFEERLYAIERYVEGLRALRPGAEESIVFAGIIGVPTGLEDASPAAILDDPRMEYTDVVDANGVLQDGSARWSVFTEPACFRCASDPTVTDWRDCPDDDDPNEAGPDGDPDRNEDLQWAAPGRRYVELAARLEEEDIGSVIRSICTDDFGPAMTDILARIGEALGGYCLPRPLHANDAGGVRCEVVEVLPEGMRCAEREDAGREATPVRLDLDSGGEPREVCRVAQLLPTEAERSAGAAPEGRGWFYDDYTDSAESCRADPEGHRQRIGFTEGATPLPGARVRLECLEPVQGSVVENAACVDDSQCPGGYVCVSAAGERASATACAGAGCTCLNPTCALDL